MTRCQDGEDFNYLAICAATKDWSTLEDGLVKPHYMSEEGAHIAKWVLSLRGTQSWPPDLASLVFHFGAVEWPSVPTFKGHDARIWAREVLYDYQKGVVADAMDKLAEVTRTELDSYKRAALLKELYTMNTELAQLPDPKTKTFTVGQDYEENMEIIMPTEISSFAKLRTGIKAIDESARPFTPGIYALFGRPKSTKSWKLLEILYNMAVDQGQTVVLVDPENDRSTIMTRLACLHGGINNMLLQDIRTKVADGEDISDDEQLVLNATLDALNDLGEKARIVIVGKDHFDPEVGGIPADVIFQVAEQHQTKIVFIDQIHKIHVRGAAKREQTDASRIKTAVEYCDAQEGYLIWATTQQNRKDDGGKLKMPTTAASTVFGSDAVAQNVQFLAHVHVWSLPEDDGVLQMLTIELCRGSRRATGRVFTEASFCDRLHYLSEDEGAIRANECIIFQERKASEAKSIAEKRQAKDSQGSSEHKVRELDLPRATPRDLQKLLRGNVE